MKYLFDDNWKFYKEGESIDVNLPHTWNNVDGQTNKDYYRGTCVYTKEFVKPDLKEDEECFIEFRGVNSSSIVYLNDEKIKSHDGGYSTFRVNITSHLKENNILKVEVDNSVNDYVYPQKADFTFYGGIYRDVYLLIKNKVHFDLDYYGGEGVYVDAKIDGTVNVKVYTNGGDKVDISVGDKTQTIDLVNNVGSTTIKIDNCHLWNGVIDPYLYTLKASLYSGDKLCDEYNTRFGFREYYFDSENGFYLNGKSYPLHGVSRHQDREKVGNALNYEMHKEDVDIILDMGANSIRLAHYQHDQYFYDLCDEKGLVVWAEIPYITVHMPKGRDNTISQMKELIVQNYNHTSIVCWGLSNEISLQGVDDDLLENHQILNDLVHKMDPNRVSAMANLFMLETDSPLVSLPDIIGYNLYYGWYVGEMDDNDAFFDKFHKEHPNIKIGLTEYGADSIINVQSPKPKKGDYSEGYQALYHEHMLEMFSTRPYIWGTYVWNMFEFAAAGRNEGNDPGKNHKGLVTFDRKIKKDAYYIYKAYWSEKPFVHLCGRRYVKRLEENTEIKAYSNLDELTLFVDGKEISSISNKYIFKWNINITGKHHIKVVSGDLIDEMDIEKVDEPCADYFISKDKVKNWFDEDTTNESNGYFTLNDTLKDISNNQNGKAIIDNMMKQMMSSVAGGMGKNAKIPEAMMEIVSRQPLKKLLVQAGIDLNSEVAKQLEMALSQIRK